MKMLHPELVDNSKLMNLRDAEDIVERCTGYNEEIAKVGNKKEADKENQKLQYGIDYQTFLIASVDTSRDAFVKYCKRAYTKCFSSDQEFIEAGVLTDYLCNRRYIKRDHIKTFMDQVDDDKSNTITYKELFCTMLENLDPKDIPLDG